MNIFRNLMIVWLLIGFIFWTFYIYILKVEFSYGFLYYYFIVILVGIPIWIYRKNIKNKLLNWKLNSLSKFLLLGYGFVLFEEIFAALSQHLDEGFNFAILLQRIGQHWILNIVIFSAFYFGWYYLLKRFKYSYKEVFFVAGLVGLFYEPVLAEGLSNLPYLFLMAPVMIFVYGLMITFPMLSLQLNGKKEINPFLKYVLSLVIILLFTIIPFLIIHFLLKAYVPWTIPPRALANF